MIVSPSVPTEVVIDASVVVKWLKTRDETRVAAARRIRHQHQAGTLILIAPGLLFLEIMNVAARKWRWPAARLARLAGRLAGLGLTIEEPSLERVAHWSGLGLTAYDACYVALAERRNTVLVTTDEQIKALGGRLVRPL